MWLECSARPAPDHGRVRRLLSTLVGPAHTRRLIFDAEALAA
jgi:hypothetical protein